MRVFVLGGILLGLVGCSGSRGQSAYDPNAMTLCVENVAVGYGNIVVDAGATRFRVSPDDQVCRQMRQGGAGVTIRAVSTGGGITGPLRFFFQLPWGTCWHWRVASGPGIPDVVPCE